jgi:hypothetical protein
MFIYAGRTAASRYDNRAPIHIAFTADPENPAQTLCTGAEISPVKRGPAIDVTCTRCLSKVDSLQNLFSDPEAMPGTGFLAADMSRDAYSMSYAS